MSPQAYRLKPWNEVVTPHDDIVSGRLEMSTYAADLGAVERGDPNTPRVYRDARELFRTTYMTRNLHRLLADVLGLLGGGTGDRVIQLRTPFGGGKTHALLSLYHLLRSRDSIDVRDLSGLPDPGPGRVAVLSGLDLDPFSPREVDGLAINTLWGELAFRLGGQPGYEKVRRQDEEGAPPGNDVLRPLMESGPVLILLDEVLVYVQRAGGREGTHPFRRQIMNFLQGLTEMVRGTRNVVMVYSLQMSEHEAAGDLALLSDLDHLVTRVDAKREPVSDDEITRVVQRRLFPSFLDDAGAQEVAREVAREFALSFGRLREGYAQTAAERRAAREEAERFEERAVQSYPFHPELLDLMYHRWGSLPSYQRTRGALQFLAATAHAVWHGARPARPLIGPGDVALEDEPVRGAFFSQVGQREQYSSVLAADITGETARAQEVDRRMGADSPTLAQLQVGTRAATAVMLYSFGGRQGEDRGVVESDLLQALVAPDLDRNVVTTALHDLREELLYLHYTGRRYRFEPKANLNLLIAEERKRYTAEEVLDHVKRTLAETLRAAGDAVVLWPPDATAIADGVSLFRIVYLGPEWGSLDDAAREDGVRELVERHRSGRREYKNSLAFAVPGGDATDRARNAARNAMAIRAVIGQARQLDLDREQVEELRERERSTGAELGAAIDRLYELVLVPVPAGAGDEAVGLEPIDLRAQLAAGRGIHERIIDGLRKHVFDSITPSRIATLAKLDTERSFVACEELVKWFFTYLAFPKLKSEAALKDAITRGTAAVFGYVPAADIVEDALVPRRSNSVWFGDPLRPEEVDLGPGSYIVSAELAAQLRGPVKETADDGGQTEDVTTPTGSEAVGDGHPDTVAVGQPTRYHAAFAATAEQLFRVIPALQNLAERSSRFVVRIDVDATAETGFDRSWMRNAVEEHFEEAGVDTEARLE